jgi:2-hydroxychromene-2-carboxylate isomerase
MHYSVDFWFDFSSPYAYLAATQIQSICTRNRARLNWRPLLLGGLFRELGQNNVPLFAMSPEKQGYMGVELQRFAWWWGVPFLFSPHFPLRTVLPLRAALLMPEPGSFIRAVFAAAWAEGKDIAEPEVLIGCGASPSLLARASEAKEKLLANTTFVREHGIFGVPTMDISCSDGRSWRFWGQDRLSQVELCLQGMDFPG